VTVGLLHQRPRQFPEIRADPLHQSFGDLADQFAAKAFLAHELAELPTPFRRRARPVILELLVLGPKLIFVDVAVLNDECGDPFRSPDG
jgi:hypothetical protein